VQTVYDAAGGADGLLRLAAAWHERVLGDDVVSHAFSHGFRADHTERLAAYWGEALGGPTAYSDRYGDESEVVRLHSGNGPHEEMDRRAIACFDLAMADVGIGEGDPLRSVLHDYFAWATTTTMSRFHDSADDVPNGLAIPRWSWNGLQGSPGVGQDPGPFFHGTKAELGAGDLLDPGRSSNYGERRTARFVYLTATLDAAVWGAELAVGDGRGRIYRVEPTGPFEDDPNLTDQRFPGNPTRSYRTREPLRVLEEVAEWEGHPPEVLAAMREHLAELDRLGVEAINE
jgi:hemoglobin